MSNSVASEEETAAGLSALRNLGNQQKTILLELLVIQSIWWLKKVGI